MLSGQEEPIAPVKGEFGQQFLNGANIRSNFTIISFKCATQRPWLHTLYLSVRNIYLCCSRVFASLIAGLATGVLGVTGWGGFAYYFLVHALVSDCTV